MGIAADVLRCMPTVFVSWRRVFRCPAPSPERACTQTLAAPGAALPNARIDVRAVNMLCAPVRAGGCCVQLYVPAPDAPVNIRTCVESDVQNWNHMRAGSAGVLPAGAVPATPVFTCAALRWSHALAHWVQPRASRPPARDALMFTVLLPERTVPQLPADPPVVSRPRRRWSHAPVCGPVAALYRRGAGGCPATPAA